MSDIRTLPRHTISWKTRWVLMYHTMYRSYIWLFALAIFLFVAMHPIFPKKDSFLPPVAIGMICAGFIAYYVYYIYQMHHALKIDREKQDQTGFIRNDELMLHSVYWANAFEIRSLGLLAAMVGTVTYTLPIVWMIILGFLIHLWVYYQVSKRTLFFVHPQSPWQKNILALDPWILRIGKKDATILQHAAQHLSKKHG